jgi:hypothetical protein
MYRFHWMEWGIRGDGLIFSGYRAVEIRCHVFAIDNTLRVSTRFAEQAHYGVAASIVRTVSRPLARAASTVPMSRPW